MTGLAIRTTDVNVRRSIEERFSRTLLLTSLIVTVPLWLFDTGIVLARGQSVFDMSHVVYVTVILVSSWQIRRDSPNANWLTLPLTYGLIALNTYEQVTQRHIGGVSAAVTVAVVVTIGTLMGVTSGRAWFVASGSLAITVMGWGIWSGLRASLPGSAPYLEGIVPAIAIVVGSWLFRSITHELDQRAREADRMAHFHKALALCSHYLHEYREGVPEDALNALLAATKASSVFASRNVDDPELGLCTSMLAEVVADGVPEDPPGTWDLVPWTDVPYARDRLANGQTVYYQLSETSPAEQELYRDTGVTSECNIPIMIDGKWHGFLGFSYVDGLQAEESDFELLETAARIFGAYWKVKEQRAELEYLVRSKDELIAAVSHELRTPLTGILGFAEALVETAPSEQMEFIELIADQSRDMADIIETTKIQALAAGHNMVTEGDPTLALGDPVRIRQIVRNLVSNALNHGGLETRIEVSSSNGRSEVAVWDDGNSLSTEATGQLFDRFYTRQQPRPQPGSVGLGLFVSRRLARLMGGDLTVEVDDVGTTFRLSLPHPTPTLEAAQDND